MKQTRLGMLLLSLGVSASMLLSACGGETPTATVVPAVATATVPEGVPTNTTAAAPATDTAGTGSGGAATATTGGGGTASGGVVKIAVDLPVGGAEGANGIPTRQGIQLAIDQANAAGGVTLDGKSYQIQMFFLDDVPPGGQAHDPAQGSKNADAFIADPDVMAMVGPFNSNVARAMMPKLNTAGLASISPANTATDLTLPEFNPNLKDLRPSGKITYFRVCTTDNIQGPVGADYALDKLGKKKAYVLDDTEVYGKGIADQFAKEFAAKGGTVLDHKGVPKGTTDFSSIMSTVAASGADILYYGGTQSNGIPLARKAMTAAGLKIPLMGGDGIVESGYTDAAGADAEGDYGTVAAVNANLLPDAKSFIDAYGKAFASDQWKGVPQAYSANAYDATNIIIAAMKTAGKKDREAVRAAIAATKDFKGAIGTTSFDANGDTTNRWISIYQVKNGAWTYIDQQQFGASSTGTTGGATATTGGTGSTAPSGGVVKIAVDLPVGGAEGANGIPTRQGIQLAIDQANAAGGVTLDGKSYQIQMYFLDDVPPGGQAHDPAQGSKNADAFIADPDVMAMVGPFNSNVARAMMPKLNTAGLASISPANTATDLTLPEFNPNLKDLRPSGKITYFRVCTTDNIQGPVGADYALDKLGKKKAYVLDDTEVYGKGIADQFAKEFAAKGGTVLDHKGVPKGTTDFSSIMSTVAASGADILYYGGTQSNGIPLARKAMTAAGLKIPLMGGDGIVESGYTDAAGADAEGDYGTVAAVNANLLPDAKSFIDAYGKAFASDQWKGVPQAYSANAYDATNIIIAAMKTAGKKDREAVRAAIAATKDFKGAIGTTSFDANGDTTNRWISIYEVKNGAWTYIDQQQFTQ